MLKKILKRYINGISFYLGEDDNSIKLGNYKEWKAAGRPAMPN